ncbi:cysteinyl-tRNA synthetase [Candidatus Pelagibacter sp. HTCC7211]|uniref:cysteine--tRNA ligase n=1 Tax=Pelagibacter sp. (strain HTCC7211) TaxID=439493 RepID=UPI000183BE52|nr:cysteine--tRNA ligase [Candidatus Pelagibacter sp. HTCC7211]EDZ61027.1 cysteinyl-tRNA synthetase [Candidatus Pelagibacter sp. HTCC7211]MBD1151377.1 cysteine--tRNA ligase [Pelagibacterales bacterium SAG-MED25]
MGNDIFLTNNLSNKKEKFVPLDEKNIGMYVCGPTVYDDPHIGNARPIVIFDILFKVLKKKFSNVTYVRNITDVDDKIIKSSKEKNISISDLTQTVIKSFNEDCNYLNCENPSQQPKATEHIDLMIEMISELIKKGFAYENNQHVYFEVKKFDDYGKLSNKKLEDLIAGSRIEVSDNKKNSEDFVLWKPSLDNEPAWDSPWGKGRPGWHLECSAMSKKFLGNEFDIHGGGIDLIFPHHENEIAQSRCANDTDVFANYWLHNAFITMSNEKMAKSQGNILKIKDFRNKVSGQVLRLALISAHYKQPLDWNDKLLEDCQNTIDKWYNVYLPSDNDLDEEIIQPLYDDINTPGYIANLHKLYDKANKGDEKDKQIFNSACNFIGLLQETKEVWLNHKKDKIDISEEEIENKIQLRNTARANKDYKEADNIRDYLLDKGVLIEDKDGKTIWKFK